MSDQYDILDENESIPEGHRSGFIALVGRPNVGKSTLLNALLKQKIAIVTPRPQTTRIRQLGILTEPDYQIVFVDTPGLLSTPRHKLDEFMVATAQEALRDADLVLWLVDVSVLPGEEDRQLAAQLAALPRADGTRAELGPDEKALLRGIGYTGDDEGPTDEGPTDETGG